jgi:hypothetical protein
MADKTKEDQQWSAIEKIRDDMSAMRENIATATTEIRGDVKTVTRLFELHISDPAIHERPPCEHVKTIDRRLWAALGAAATSMGLALWSFFKGS